MLLLITVLLPILCGALLPAFRFKNRRLREGYVLFSVLLTSALVFLCCFTTRGNVTFSFLHFTQKITCSLHLDDLGRVFTCMIAFLWPLASLYAFEYMEHEGRQNSFFAWYTLAFGITLGISMAGDVVTLYLFYELLTLVTLPLVMHGMGKERVAAGLKYLYYSLFGAGLAFAGIMLVLAYGETSAFVPGGVLRGLDESRVPLMRLGYLLVFVGMGVKAAVFPFHGWLVSASAAPTPVTALLHAVAVVKAGVFGLIRLTWFSFGPDLLRDSFAQWIPFALAAFTILYGSVNAVRETHFKRRLVYSTISNLSYILLGTVMLTPRGLEGAMLHMVYHAFMKITLFGVCGAVQIRAGLTEVSQWHGLARRMPLCMALFVPSALAMTGIPPLDGFHSKWTLAMGALETGGPPAVIGCAVLALSAVLTAVYLLVPAFHAFFSVPAGSSPQDRLDPSLQMLLPLSVWTLTTLVLSFSYAAFTPFVSSIVRSVIR